MASYTDTSPSPNWRDLAMKKHQAILDAIPQEWHLPPSILANPPQNLLTPSFLHPLLTPLELEITTAPLPTLLTHLATAHWTSLAVTTAFAHRAAIAHQLTNCLSEFPLAQALATARALDDAHLAENKQTTTTTTLGALHGLPVSLKDSIDVRDVCTTLGFVSWTTRPPRTQDSVLAAILREQGAVLFAKTAVPQGSWATETFGNVIAAAAPPPPAVEKREEAAAAKNGKSMMVSMCGDVPNPLNTALSAGGSSGGEAALLAFRGSPLGFGTDVGGSVRWPAGSVGAYGLRPSKGRLPYRGIASVLGGLEAVTDVGFSVGPMSAGSGGGGVGGGDDDTVGGNVEALGIAMRAVLGGGGEGGGAGGRPWERDPLVVEMPWREEVYRSVKEQQGGKLVFGVLQEDGLVDLHPNVRRAVDVVTKILKKAGHEVIPFHPPGDPATVDTFWNEAAYANLSYAHEQFRASGEPVDPRMPRAFDPSRNEKGLSTAQVQALNVRIRKYRAEYLRYWMSTATHAGNSSGRPVDAVISPVAVVAAARRGRMRWAGYTYAVVLNDHTSAVLPVLTTDKNIDVRGPVPTGQGSHARLNKAVYDDYDPEIYHGQPVNVQIIGRRFQEEKVLAITEYVDGLIKEHGTVGCKL